MTALFLVGWFWQGFLHFHETTPLASNENTALKLEVNNEYDAMLEQEYALVQPQNEVLSRNHHFKHKGEDKSGFSIITITKASKCIPSVSPIGFIKYSVLPSRPCEASLFWALMYQCWRRKGHLDTLSAPPLQRGFVELDRGGEGSIQALNNVVQWGPTSYVAQHSLEEGYSVDTRDPQLLTDPTFASETYPVFTAGAQFIGSTVSPKARRMKILLEP